MKRRILVGIDGEVPRTKAFKAEFLPAFLLQFAGERHDVMFDGVVEAETILRRVIEALVIGKSVGAEIGESGGLRDLIAQDEHLVEQLLHFGGILQAALGDGFPGGLAPGDGRVPPGCGPCGRGSVPGRRTGPSCHR